MTRLIPFFILQTLVFRGTGAGSRYESERFDLAGVTKLVLQFKVFRETPGTSVAGGILFSQDGIRFDHSVTLTEGDAPNEITAGTMYRFAIGYVEGTDGNIATFQVLARAFSED